MKKDTILIVDDEEVNRFLLSEIIGEDYEILEAEDGCAALEIIEAEKDNINVILLDIIMPKLDGFGVMDYMKRKGYSKHIPVVMITGDTSSEVEEKGFTKGASDFITKPFNPTVVHKRVLNVMELYLHQNQLEEMVRRQTVKIEKQSMEMKTQLIETLSTVVEFRNTESGEHIKRIKGFTRILADCVSISYKEYGLTDEVIDRITAASTMHDIGKIAIPDNILLKPGKLTPIEFDVMKSHTTRGCEILTTLEFMDDKAFYECCYKICRHHHERFDGKGYPDQLSGDSIPIEAQIVSLADVYDALVSERVYKDKYTPEKAYDMILHGECGIFNPKILECFKAIKGRFEKLANENNYDEILRSNRGSWNQDI